MKELGNEKWKSRGKWKIRRETSSHPKGAKWEESAGL